MMYAPPDVLLTVTALAVAAATALSYRTILADAARHLIARLTGRRVIYMNLYKSGWFHRCGKPLTLDRHAGDCYTSRAQALADIDPPSHYITTVAVLYRDPDNTLRCNGADSQPVPIAVTRKQALRGEQT